LKKIFKKETMESVLKETHIRKNILTGEEVLVSPHRTQRPWQGKLEEEESKTMITHDPNCYLCPGNERASKDINPDYEDTFVFKNDYAALNEETAISEYKEGLLEDLFFSKSFVDIVKNGNWSDNKNN
jgi:UDPglucose--hexose-1-phosphate uridylyltransferase